jgi:hypothetical protein
MLPAEGLYSRSLCQIPDTNSFVFSTRYDEFMLRMEDSTGDIVEMTTAGVDLPGLEITHSPQLDLPVIRSRYDERKCWVEDSIVDTAVMPLQDILDGGEVVKCVECTRG